MRPGVLSIAFAPTSKERNSRSVHRSYTKALPVPVGTGRVFVFSIGLAHSFDFQTVAYIMRDIDMSTIKKTPKRKR